MLRICAVTDIGLARDKNQDGFFVCGLSANNTKHKEIYLETDDSNSIALVADGVGSTSDGEYAVERLITFFKNQQDLPIDELINIINREIYDDALSEKKNAATTVAGVIIGEKITVFNVGDSKVFFVNNGYLDQKSTDDTMESLIIEAGIDGSFLYQSGKSPLTQCIGNSKERINVHISEIETENDILICTDGLTDSLELDEIEAVVKEKADIRKKMNSLIELAYKNGCEDNITIIIISFEKEPMNGNQRGGH